MSVAAAQTAFWVFAALMGLSLSSIFLVYTGAEHRADVLHHGRLLRRAVALRLHHEPRPDRHGLVPDHGPVRPDHRDRSSTSSWQSSALQFAISAIGVLIFAGLTAYDTQKIKEMYFDGDDGCASPAARPSWAR